MSGKRYALSALMAAAALVMTGCGKADDLSSNSVSAVTDEAAVIEVHTVIPTNETTAAPTGTTSSTTSAVTTYTTAEPETEPATEPVTESSDDGQLVLIKDYIPDIFLDIRYAGTNNFTGQVVYENDDAYLCYGTVKKLIMVQDSLRERGLSLIIWDAYRPVEAQQRLWDVYPDPIYVAYPGNGITSHSRGNTIDLGIVAADGSYVPVPSGFDEFSTLADRNYADVPAEAAQNSQLLEDIMTANGFTGYWGEWWHYSDTAVYQWHF